MVETLEGVLVAMPTLAPMPPNTRALFSPTTAPVPIAVGKRSVCHHLNSVNGLVGPHVCRLAVSFSGETVAGTQRLFWHPQWRMRQRMPHAPVQSVSPVPDKLTCCGLLPPSSLIETSALRDPTWVGLKTTVMVQDFPPRR
jgi:hypothetical protein